MLKSLVFAAALVGSTAAQADVRRVAYLQDVAGERIKVADLVVTDDGSYTVTMNDAPFSDHFLSMRPFKCLDGPEKTWCHVPYPYANNRRISQDLTDLEYDFLFLWKGSGEYGISMWNGVYYKLEPDADRLVGRLHEVDMDILSAPPAEGDLRPIRAKHLEEGEPDSHWLPILVIE